MPPDKTFPKLALAEAVRTYAVTNDVRRLASRVRAEKKGVRMASVSVAEVAGLIADKAEDHSEARRLVLKTLRRAFQAEGSLDGRDPRAIQEEIGAFETLGPRERAAWTVRLLSDPRPQVWALAERIEATVMGAGIAKELQSELDTTRKGKEKRERELMEKTQTLRKLETTSNHQAESLELARRDVQRLREELAAERERRIQAERTAADVRARHRRRRAEVDERRSEVLDLRRALQVRETGATTREVRDRQSELEQLRERYQELNRDYAALRATLRALEERLEEAWEAGQLEEKHLKPLHPDASLVVEPPLETDDAPARAKVRMPTVPHHWPGGEERFVRFLERLARSPYVTRVRPRRFQPVPDHGLRFVTDEGDLVARVSDGDYAAEVLVITTAVHRGQGEHVRRSLESVYEEHTL